MAAAIEKLCPSCSRRHQLCCPDTDLLKSPKICAYAYECPVTGEAVRLEMSESDWGKVLPACPAVSVIMREVT